MTLMFFILKKESKMATKNDNNRHYKKINDGSRRNCMHLHIFAHIHIIKFFFFMSEYGS